MFRNIKSINEVMKSEAIEGVHKDWSRWDCIFTAWRGVLESRKAREPITTVHGGERLIKLTPQVALYP